MNYEARLWMYWFVATIGEKTRFYKRKPASTSYGLSKREELKKLRTVV